MTGQGDSTIGSHGFSFAPRSGSRASTRSGTHEPAMGLRTDRLGGPRGESGREALLTGVATASGEGCPGTRVRGIIALLSGRTPRTSRLCAASLGLSRSYIHSSVLLYIQILEERQ